MKTIAMPAELMKEFISDLRNAMFTFVEGTESNYKCGFCEAEEPSYRFKHYESCAGESFIAAYEKAKENS